MSPHSRSNSTSAVPKDYLGAREITAFHGRVANDNGLGAARPRGRRASADWALPVAAFISGLTAALVVSGLSDLLGIG